MGRTEFNSSRVRSHYIHTHMKLELEKRLLDETLHYRRLIVTEPASRERNTPVTFPMESVSSSISSLSPCPAFHLSPELCGEEDNSCSSSDMMDTSCSSSLSLDTEATGSSPSEQATLDVDDKGVAHILSFDDSDEDGCPCVKEYERINIHQPLTHDLSTKAADSITGLSTDDNSQSESNTNTSQLEYVDENANQVILESENDPFDIPNTPSPSSDHNSYMDLSLSSDSDLVFFDSFHEYGPSLSHNHFKAYSHMDYISHHQFPSCPSPGQIEDSGVNLLESLVGSS